MNTREYMDAIKLRHNIVSDYALAKFLNAKQSSVSRWRTGDTTIGDELAPRVADLLNLRVEKVLADLHAERTSNDALRAIWKRVAAAFACAASIGLTPTPFHGEAQASVLQDINSRHKRRKDATAYA